ncbi:outer-membrane receptor for ferric coprogen and ferric-rhodotorulic acid [Marinobacter segnicrescens]|uniref:Outer-membrane receptor for ferric coprogen and ferric-rhodotorulic acid n=1 Tax=Marinobacter segnicrescens TaxID=430453 RepID=A0A1H9ZTH2_9GAMM|nr:TonB-dependent siderophore receptor [Marinobacter segnicrescens]SES85017.1 outer-membrane receptor for ferric coprogen and ferric-rhodotorulic acid [Marinobacter segnicrescens]
MYRNPQPSFRRKTLVTAMMCAALPGVAVAQEDEPTALEALEITANRGQEASEATESYISGSSTTSMKMELSHREVPQAVTVITREQMDDFAQNDINDVLEGTTGVTVESVETDRTYYTSRGFDINNFQYDGVGMPAVYDNVQGELDTAFFDRVEVVRGANGLMTGSGSPAATVNFIRKRPTADTNASVTLTGGSWDKKRIVGDVSGAVSESGAVRGRVVAGYEDKNSYIDRYSNEKQMFYGVLEADLTDTTLLTLGHAVQTSDTDSPLWGALPLFYTDGSATDFARSTSTASDWSYWDNTQHNSFVELQQELAGGWRAKGTVFRLENESDSELFYQYGTPDRETGDGLLAYPSQYDLDVEQWVVDTYATGPFQLANRVHELVLGASWSRSETVDESRYGQGIGSPLPPLNEWDGNYPKPSFDNGVGGSDWTDRETATYAAARWSLTDQLTAITGLRLTWLDNKGESYGNTKESSYDAVETPYAGLIYDINDDHSVYASYTEIFTPQTEVDINRDRLDPIDGVNYEVGLKSEFQDDRVNTTLALFQTEQQNVAEVAGTFAGSADSYYTAVDGLTSRGVEAEVVGDLTDRIQLFAGYTYVDIEDKDGSGARSFVPEHLAQLRATWEVPAVDGLKLGSKIRWQSEITQEQGVATGGPNAGETIVTKQDSYAVLDLMASYDFARNWNATLNVNNVTDEKYIESLKKFGASAQGFYGEPANASMTVSWTY